MSLSPEDKLMAYERALNFSLKIIMLRFRKQASRHTKKQNQLAPLGNWLHITSQVQDKHAFNVLLHG